MHTIFTIEKSFYFIDQHIATPVTPQYFVKKQNPRYDALNCEIDLYFKQNEFLLGKIKDFKQ